MNSAKKVSVIIPNYNGAKYISDCLSSVLDQDYANLEVIVIDDGSTDESVRIVKRFCKDERVKLIQSNHLGPNRARKSGLDVCTGDYVMFVDSDDYISKDAVGTIAEAFSSYDVDAIRFNYCDAATGKIMGPVANKQNQVIKSSKIKELLLTTYKLNSLWSQCYKRVHLVNINSFNTNLRLGEDFLTNLEIHKNTEKMLILGGKPLYYYRKNVDSITRKVDQKNVFSNLCDRITISKIAIDIANQYKSTLKGGATFAQLKMVREYLMKIAFLKNYKKRSYLEDIEKVLPCDAFQNVDQKLLNEYFKKMGIVARLKYRGIIRAIISGNYKYIWRYILLARLILRIKESVHER